MNHVWIIGKGISLNNLKKEHIGEGLIITINSAIEKIESLDLPNLIFSMAKDGASPDYLNECPSMDCHHCPWLNVYPKKAILMLHKHESVECMPDFYPRMIFDAETYGLSWRTESVLVAIEFALSLEFDIFHFVSFDSVTNNSIESYMPDGSILSNSLYSVQAERLIERVKTLNHEFIEPK